MDQPSKPVWLAVIAAVVSAMTAQVAFIAVNIPQDKVESAVSLSLTANFLFLFCGTIVGWFVGRNWHREERRINAESHRQNTERKDNGGKT